MTDTLLDFKKDPTDVNFAEYQQSILQSIVSVCDIPRNLLQPPPVLFEKGKLYQYSLDKNGYIVEHRVFSDNRIDKAKYTGPLKQGPYISRRKLRALLRFLPIEST